MIVRDTTVSDLSYVKAVRFMDYSGWFVEDWGCGDGRARDYFAQNVLYTGVDLRAPESVAAGRTSARFCRVDLRQYVPEPRPDGVILRHVLEFNREWREILAKAVDAAQRRLVIVLSVEPTEMPHDVVLGEDSSGGVVLAISRPALDVALYGLTRVKEAIPETREIAYYVTCS